VSDHDPVLRQHGYHSLRIARVVAETHEASSFVFDVPAELEAVFRYQPGQFCTFRVHIDGDEQLRSYSMSSAPATDSALTVTVKRVVGGLSPTGFSTTSRRATRSSSPSRQASSAHRSRIARCSASVAAAVSRR
jgi:NAD(P)H-flavin reductase